MLKIAAHISKKVPLPNERYSSQQYGASLEMEVSDASKPEEMWNHFIEHIRNDADMAALGIDDAVTYVRRARKFVNSVVGTLPNDLLIGLRRNGTRVVLNMATGEMSSMNKAGQIATYFVRNGSRAERYAYWLKQGDGVLEVVTKLQCPMP